MSGTTAARTAGPTGPQSWATASARVGRMGGTDDRSGKDGMKSKQGGVRTSPKSDKTQHIITLIIMHL